MEKIDRAYRLQEERPEALGISSKHIENLLDDFEQNGLFLHSFAILRHGRLAAEGYYKPITREKMNRVYSVSKSFTSAAIGLLADEGRLSLSDKVHTFFPDKCPADIHPYIAEATIRDLLIMASPFSECSYTRTQSEDWTWTFFNTKPDKPAGTVYCYDTSGTYILDAIIERITGMPFLTYMQDKLLKHIGFSEDARCIKAPDKYSWGGSGVLCTTRDLAKFALVFMNKGNVGGKQLLSEEYVRAATSKQIDNNPGGHEAGMYYGYGYQIWITRDNGFAFCGMGNQEVICLPDKDLVFVCTADNQGNEAGRHLIYRAFWQHIVDHLSDAPLKEDEAAQRALNKRIENLHLTLLPGERHSAMEAEVNGVEYEMAENPMGISKIRLEFLADYGKLCYTTPRGDKEISFGYGAYREDTFPETHYSGDTIGTPANRPYRCANCAAWVEPHKLAIKVNILGDYLGNLTITLGFKGAELGMAMHKTAEWFLDEYQGFAGGTRR